MACLIDNGYTLGCRDNVGGIKKVFIGTVVAGEDVSNYTFVADEITATTSAIAYFTFEQEMEAGSFSQNGTYSTENGTVFFDQQLTLIFHKNTTASRNQLLVLSQANVRVIIQDQRDQFWLMGYSNGVRATAGTMATGKAFGDLNGTTITLQGKEPQPAYRIDAATVTLLGTATPEGAGFDIN